MYIFFSILLLVEARIPCHHLRFFALNYEFLYLIGSMVNDGVCIFHDFVSNRCNRNELQESCNNNGLSTAPSFTGCTPYQEFDVEDRVNQVRGGYRWSKPEETLNETYMRIISQLKSEIIEQFLHELQFIAEHNVSVQ